MELTALFLTLLSGLGHAVWNYLAKKSDDKETFICWMLIIRALLLLPVLIFRPPLTEISSIGWCCIIGSSFFWTLSIATLGKAYEKGELSIVYPLARSSPMYIPLWAALFLGESLSPIGILGIITVCVGGYTIQLNSISIGAVITPVKSLKRKYSQYALASGIFGSIGPVIDKKAMSIVSPLVYNAAFYGLMALFYSLYIFSTKGKSPVLKEWEINKNKILLAGVMGLSYIFILLAMRISNVSYVMSARQISIVIGVVMGILLLKEKYATIRIISSILICTGIILIGLS